MEIYHVCRVAVAPLRRSAADSSEIVSQLLFGDRVTLIEKTEKWCYVKTHHDNYEGWMDYKQLQLIPEIQYKEENAYHFITKPQLDNTLIDAKGTKYYLSPASTLPFYENGFCYLGNEKFEVTQEPFIADAANFMNKVEKVAHFYENTPYLWGGRTLFGIDCSGFTQTVYKLLGLNIRRDASQQAEQGNLVDFLASARLGDLAFFDNEEGRITHVGLMLANDKIIHAAGKVRIDPIDDQGIYNAELGKYTHKLRIIKRFV
ncbi:C40 family peptidase [Pedobacter montanisoli]|uniref:C40 family peptidase n=1 Tax=Pedobacter montanisoli TaxID=2923277 RepID=A0ABS9ZZV6_9SPHI|nr:C40 family peptidase [Pedobacter montanisoli]MCJ0743848.1 C40 family peptidase [Pedobacter montanisoli]